MKNTRTELLRARLPADHLQRLTALPNPTLHEFVADAIELCEPDSVFVCTDRPEDIAYVRRQAVERAEETPLRIEGHTVHFDGYFDQGRDREVTRYLVPETETLSEALNQVERGKGLSEVRGFLKGSMHGREMVVRFLCLGPTNSPFSIPCVQCTDSFYVAHSEDLLYRTGYEEFRRTGDRADFFRILHSAGRLDERMTSSEPDKKRIYIDYTADAIYSVNTQYAGNTVGLKKLALRLTIRKAEREGWLAEHMFLMGVHGPGGRKTYFTGAFPSACGKTSTAMLPGETIVGDDIAYLRDFDGRARAVNAESGIFGIIQSVNPRNDPAIHEVLTTPGEVIFSNVLVKDGRPYWLEMGADVEMPRDGVNYSGEWQVGKKGPDGKEVPLAHKNARYTVALKAVANVDPELDNPDGVPVGGIIYGGRAARCPVPVRQSFDWAHGIVTCGGALETETTFAVIGQEGRVEVNLMSIQDFVSIPLGRYIANNLSFGDKLRCPPPIFGVNYFLRDTDGRFLNGLRDKAVWLKWMELRVHGEADAVRGPTGWLPRYDDLARLFRDVLQADYSRDDYVRQFTIPVPENLARLDRVEAFYRDHVPGAPAAVARTLREQRRRLEEAQARFGDRISPFDLCSSAPPLHPPAGVG
ncbi:MAG: phosphoenolpyruvate carboxykinase (GTP) [Candidatus Brocadiaceae bacterium]|nr:phosphoenolpyruvate carboxykinase (GTP) [Candidatus Brocadiaceae bacterium]